MAPDGLAGFWTGLKRADGKGMAEIHEPGASALGAAGDPGGYQHLVKGLRHHGRGERPVATRDKEMRVGPRGTPALCEIGRKCGPRRGMERQQAAFLKLALSDEQAVIRHIREVEGAGFRHPHPGDGEQPKQGTVGLWP
jgi:hypothetical protein